MDHLEVLIEASKILSIEHIRGKMLLPGDALSRAQRLNAHCEQDQEPEYIMDVHECVKQNLDYICVTLNNNQQLVIFSVNKFVATLYQG